MVMELRNLTFLIQDNKILKEMEEDFGRILIMVQQNSPPKPTFASCSQPPHFATVQQDCRPYPAPAISAQPTQTNPYPASCFQPPQKPKVKTEQHIHPTVQAVKVVRSSLNQ